MVAVRWLFSFCHRAATFSLFFYLNRQSSQKCHRHTPFRQNNKLKSHEAVIFHFFAESRKGIPPPGFQQSCNLFIAETSTLLRSPQPLHHSSLVKEVENDYRNDRSQQQIKYADDQNRNQCNVQSKEPHGRSVQSVL